MAYEKIEANKISIDFVFRTFFFHLIKSRNLQTLVFIGFVLKKELFFNSKLHYFHIG